MGTRRVPERRIGVKTYLHNAIDIKHKLRLAKVGSNVLSISLEADGRIQFALDLLEGISWDVCQPHQGTARR